LAAAQMHVAALDGEPLEVQRDAHAIGSRGAEIVVENHRSRIISFLILAPMSSIAPTPSRAIDRAIIARRLAAAPALADLLTQDDVERQVMLAKDGAPRPAAVLLLVVNHPAGHAVVFTQRTAHLADHAG